MAGDQFSWRDELDFDGGLRAVTSGAQAGLRAAAEELLEEAQALAPIDSEELVKSGRVTEDDGEFGVSFDTPYAVRQHEDLTLRHDGGRRAKFLETPMRDAGIWKVVADSIRKELD